MIAARMTKIPRDRQFSVKARYRGSSNSKSKSVRKNTSESSKESVVRCSQNGSSLASGKNNKRKNHMSKPQIRADKPGNKQFPSKLIGEKFLKVKGGRPIKKGCRQTAPTLKMKFATSFAATPEQFSFGSKSKSKSKSRNRLHSVSTEHNKLFKKNPQNISKQIVTLHKNLKLKQNKTTFSSPKSQASSKFKLASKKLKEKYKSCSISRNVSKERVAKQTLFADLQKSCTKVSKNKPKTKNLRLALGDQKSFQGEFLIKKSEAIKAPKCRKIGSQLNLVSAKASAKDQQNKQKNNTSKAKRSKHSTNRNADSQPHFLQQEKKSSADCSSSMTDTAFELQCEQKLRSRLVQENILSVIIEEESCFFGRKANVNHSDSYQSENCRSHQQPYDSVGCRGIKRAQSCSQSSFNVQKNAESNIKAKELSSLLFSGCDYEPPSHHSSQNSTIQSFVEQTEMLRHTKLFQRKAASKKFHSSPTKGLSFFCDHSQKIHSQNPHWRRGLKSKGQIRQQKDRIELLDEVSMISNTLLIKRQTYHLAIGLYDRLSMAWRRSDKIPPSLSEAADSGEFDPSTRAEGNSHQLMLALVCLILAVKMDEREYQYDIVDAILVLKGNKQSQQGSNDSSVSKENPQSPTRNTPSSITREKLIEMEKWVFLRVLEGKLKQQTLPFYLDFFTSKWDQFLERYLTRNTSRLSGRILDCLNSLFLRDRIDGRTHQKYKHLSEILDAVLMDGCVGHEGTNSSPFALGFDQIVLALIYLISKKEIEFYEHQQLTESRLETFRKGQKRESMQQYLLETHLIEEDPHGNAQELGESAAQMVGIFDQNQNTFCQYEQPSTRETFASLRENERLLNCNKNMHSKGSWNGDIDQGGESEHNIDNEDKDLQFLKCHQNDIVIVEKNQERPKSHPLESSGTKISLERRLQNSIHQIFDDIFSEFLRGRTLTEKLKDLAEALEYAENFMGLPYNLDVDPKTYEQSRNYEEFIRFHNYTPYAKIFMMERCLEA